MDKMRLIGRKCQKESTSAKNKTIPVFKAAEDRLTVMPPGNACGDEPKTTGSQ